MDPAVKEKKKKAQIQTDGRPADSFNPSAGEIVSVFAFICHQST